MNTKESLDLLMGRLGGRTDPELRAKCLQEMKAFQETEGEGAEELPWFLITETAETDTTIGERRILLPSDFIREVEDEDILSLNDEGNLYELRKVGFDEAEERYVNAEPGTPQVYTIRGPYLILYPASDRVMTVQFPSYYAREASPFDSVDSHNGWFKHAADVVTYGAGVVVASLHLKDQELVGTMAALLARAQTRLQRVIVAREEANRSRRMG